LVLALHHFAFSDVLDLLRRIRDFACWGVLVAEPDESLSIKVDLSWTTLFQPQN